MRPDKDNTMTLYPVILSGGSGSRLWPLSREHFPKPLLPLTSGQSLLQETATRVDGLPELGDAVYVCNEEHRFLLAEQVAQLGRKPATIILEPEAATPLRRSPWPQSTSPPAIPTPCCW
jgi:mannose-1-phosphate guanylyltransferase